MRSYATFPTGTLLFSILDLQFIFCLTLIGLFYGRIIASFFLVISALLFLLFRGFIQSVVFARRYRTDYQFCFGKMSGIVWGTEINIKLLVKVLLFFISECVVRWTPEDLQKIQFFEPDAGLAFNIQGNGTIARIMHSVLGGFSLQSKYCTKADSSVCMTPFFPVGWWSTWVSLFTLTGLYVLTGLYENKSDYFMCRLCDRFIYRIYSSKGSKWNRKLALKENGVNWAGDTKVARN